MNLLFRAVWVLLAALRRSHLDPLDESVVRFRVLPNDLDVNLHMNNGRYLALMDLGRLDLIARMGVTRALAKRRWRPVVGSLAIRFRRALEPFETYELRSRLVCWDEKWFYIEQRFEREGRVVALAVLKGLFFGPEGNVAPQAVVDLARHPLASPPMPDAIAAWQAAEAELLSVS
ncbi:MAG TPA: thioesterase family protein [Longimicrobiaceae bacterium]|jgi:acyl-CoA thioesterase FadM|nr:thioesterase family protein [Longimicrobiaceae bacterium]